MSSWFKVWLYALGSFSDKKTKPYDKQVVLVRTFWVLLHSHTSNQNIIKSTPFNLLHCKYVNSDLKFVQLSEDYYIE